MKLSEILEKGASRFGGSPCAAIGTQHERWALTYEAAWKVLLQHEAWIKQTFEKRKEKIVVAYLSGNSIDFLLSMLACMNLETVTVALLNTRWTSSEMAAALQTADPSSMTLILYGSGFQEVAHEASHLLLHPSFTLAVPQLSETGLRKLLAVPDLPTEDWISDQKVDSSIEQVTASRDGDEDAVIVFTSGTTSGSKGVRLSHKALYVQSLAKLRHPCNYSRLTRMLGSTVPLFHVGGLSSTLSVLLAGGTWVLPASGPGFEPKSVLESVTAPILPANTLVVVPAMLHSILQEISDFDSYDSVRLLLIGGQSASPDTIRRVNRVFPCARVVQTFACTEAASSLTFFNVKPNKLDRIILSTPEGGAVGDCVGVPPPHVELALIDKDSDCVIRQPYHVGIFATRGPHVMNGYWKRGVDNEGISQYSWYLTNDVGFRDENGQFYFCGRTKDVIRTGGETVIALEVERTLLSHPDIYECAVFALPDERFGEVVCAAVVGDNNLALAGVRSFCSRQGLAGYKKPRFIFFVKELPRNSSGKVLKHKLVERFRERQPLQSKL